MNEGAEKMKYPKGKGFDLTGGLIITVILEEYSLTGTFLGEIENRYCKEPTHVSVQEDSEFILLQLTCPVDVINGPEFPIGTIIAINVEQILFIAPGGICDTDVTTTTSSN